jgi:hypothetical protein
MVQEATYAGHHAFACTATANVDVTVIGVPAEPMAASFELFIQFVE